MRVAYKAIGSDGQVIEGELSAESREAAIEQLRRRGVVPLKAETTGSARVSRRGLFARRSATPPRGRALALFTRELAIFLRAGFALDRALGTLSGLNQDLGMKALAGDLLAKVKSGLSLADAMARHEAVFPAFYIGMIRAGEAGGALEVVLERLAISLEKSEALKARVRAAMAYPAIVLLLTLVTLFVLLVWVIPEFEPLFQSGRNEPPLITTIVMQASRLTIDWGWLLPVLFALWVAFFLRARRDPARKQRQERRWLKLWIAGELIRKVETARFSRTLGTLLANGVTLIKAVEIARGTLANAAISEALGGLRAALSKGEGLAGPLRQSAAFPPMALQLIEVGDESGNLDEMLLKVADIFDEEVDRGLERMVALLVPLVTITLGMLVAIIIASMISAILGSYGAAF